MDTNKLMKPERGVNESFKSYLQRRKNANFFLKKVVKRGKMFWNSQQKGTYKRPIHER